MKIEELARVRKKSIRGKVSAIEWNYRTEYLPVFLSEQIHGEAFVLQLQSRTLQLPSKGIRYVRPIAANKIQLIVCHLRIAT